MGGIIGVISGYVSDGCCHFVYPLINTVLGVLSFHGNERRGNVAQNRIVSVGFPSVRVPVGTQCGGVAVVGVVAAYNVFSRIADGVASNRCFVRRRAFAVAFTLRLSDRWAFI